MELLSPEGLRQDGRRPRELRKLDFVSDILGNADGSAVFELGNTKVSPVRSCSEASCANPAGDPALDQLWKAVHSCTKSSLAAGASSCLWTTCCPRQSACRTH